EDDQVRLQLGGDLDDALRGVAADAHDRVDARALGHEVEDALEQAASVAGPGRAFRQGHALGHLDDAQRGQLAAVGIEQVGAEADELLRSRRVGDRDDDPGGQRPRDHDADHRLSRYGLSRSNSRAWRSTLSSARSVDRSRFSITELATRPKYTGTSAVTNASSRSGWSRAVMTRS